MAQEVGSHSKHLRDAKAQSDYRQNSHSNHKNEQHVAHYISLDIANFINSIHNENDLLCDCSILKTIVNKSDNFRMVKINTNLSNHKRIDNKLLQIWKIDFLKNILQNENIEDIINGLLKTSFKNNDCDIMQLFFTNPTILLILLQKLFKNDNILNIRVKNSEPNGMVIRAIAQTKRFQTLGFDNKYLEMARMLYSLLYDGKGNKIWDDRRNKKSFSEYLNKQKKDATYLLQALATSQTLISVDNIFAPNKNSNINIQPSVKDEQSNNETKPKKMIKGPKGGLYYINENGKKCYLKKQENKSDENDAKFDNVDHIDSKGRQIFRGKKGGLYFINKSGQKRYLAKNASN